MTIATMPKILLWDNMPDRASSGGRPSITPMPLPPCADGAPRPAMLVIPGGGYGGVCTNSEGAPIARVFNRLGYNCFVLDYRCGPFGHYPAMFQDAARAVKLIRARAGQFGIDPQQVYACGFSAGGHLAGSLGTSFCDQIDANAGDDADRQSSRLNAMILCYPVTTGDERDGHAETLRNCWGLGDDARPSLRQLRDFDLRNYLDEQTAPAFLWHTCQDQMVPMNGSVGFARAMLDAGLVCSFHLFPFGDHGMLLGLGTDTGVWTVMADEFIRTLRRRKSASAEEFHRQYTNAEQCRRENDPDFAG